MRYAMLSSAVVMLAGARVAVGQGPFQAMPGDRIRVTFPDANRPRLVGQLLERRGDTLVLRADDVGQPRVLSATEIRQLEVRIGQHRNVWKGLAIGAGAGVALGALYAALASDMESSGWTVKTSTGAVFAASTVSGALWGAVIGALIKSDRWAAASGAPAAPLETGRLRKPSGSLARRGVHLGVARAF